MKLDKVSDRVYANCEGKTGGNVGIIVLDDSVIAVDAQYPGSARDFRASIRSVTEKPVSHLILTHIHGDHIYGSQAFEDCEIVAHRRLKEKMEASLKDEWSPEKLEKMLIDMKVNRPERYWLFNGLKIVLPTKTFDDNMNLDGLEIQNLGGHSDCSSVIYVPEDKTLFAGDLIFAGRFPWAGDLTSHPETWIKSFENMLAMDVDSIVPGHGPICGKEEIETQLKWFKEASSIMRNLIREGASLEESVKPVHYPVFYDSSGGRLERSLSHWYKVLSQ